MSRQYRENAHDSFATRTQVYLLLPGIQPAGNLYNLSKAMSSQLTPPLTRASVVAAHKAIEGQIHRTPVLTSSSLAASLLGKNTLYFKAENFQKGGAFKFRGASYKLSCLTPEELANGVCTHSSGTASKNCYPPV